MIFDMRMANTIDFVTTAYPTATNQILQGLNLKTDARIYTSEREWLEVGDHPQICNLWVIIFVTGYSMLCRQNVSPSDLPFFFFLIFEITCLHEFEFFKEFMLNGFEKKNNQEVRSVGFDLLGWSQLCIRFLPNSRLFNVHLLINFHFCFFNLNSASCKQTGPFVI